MQPETRYAKSGDVHIAYQVFLVPGFVSNIELYWEHPDIARWMLRLANFARVATFDKRGTGLSDRVSERSTCAWMTPAPSWMRRGWSVRRYSGYPKAVQWRLCSRQPIPSDAEVFYGSFARASWTSAEGLEVFFGYTEKSWGSGPNLPCPRHRVRTIRPCSNGGADMSGSARARGSYRSRSDA
jgi:pimeloyl-ACP methyl ester carboxylesterase